MDYKFQFNFLQWNYYTRTTNLGTYWLKTKNNMLFERITKDEFDHAYYAMKLEYKLKFVHRRYEYYELVTESKHLFYRKMVNQDFSELTRISVEHYNKQLNKFEKGK